MKEKLIPQWLKITVSCYLCVFISIYWTLRGPTNFLWFSDIALIVIAFALWLEHRFLASMMAVNALLPDIAWNVDYFSRLIFDSHLFGLESTAYMFKQETPILIKILSFSFHFFLPILLIWTVFRLGYHRHAWKAQILLAWIVLLICYFFTDPAANINWVFGLGSEPQGWMSAPMYLVALMAFFPLAVYLPTHLLLSHIFGKN